MITLEQIWKEIQNGKPPTKEEVEWKPIKKVDYILPKFKAPNLKREYSAREKLSKVLAFIDMEKYLRYSEGCTIIPVSCNNKRLKSICGSKMEVHRLIQFMIKIGLLKVENSQYQFNAHFSKDNKSKTYQYFYDNEVKIKEYCSSNSIYSYSERNYRDSRIDTIGNNILDTAFDLSKVKFSSKLHLLRPKGMSVEKFEDYLTNILYDNYPELSHYQQLADRINDTYYSDTPEYKIVYRPKFTWSKGNTAVRKIGIRATNSLCPMPKSDRKEYLEEKHFNLSKDVKSSIPRVSLSLTHGYWVPEIVNDSKIDFYELIYNQYMEIREEREEIDTIGNNIFSDNLREAIKNLTLPAYFDFDDDRLGSHIRSRMNQKQGKDVIYKEMSYLQRAVRNVTGNNYDSEIFYHESNIYMEVLAHLLEDGYWVWQVYDSWYGKKKGVSQKEFEKYVTELVESTANDYIRKLNLCS